MSHSPARPDPSDLLDLATATANAASELILRRRAEGVSVAATKTTPTDVVTAADRESERLIRERILAARPDDAVLGEEAGAAAGSSGVRWIVDPIDGTVNYLYGLPTFAVSIAAAVDRGDGAEEVVAGVVINAPSGETWTAAKGGGAFLNGAPIHANQGAALDHALVGTGFSYNRDRRSRQAAVLSQVIVAARDIRRGGAAAVDLCSVACGRLDAFYEQGLNPWDVAAGGLIAAEAGARVEGLRGAPASAALTLAAPEPLFSSLHDLLDAAGADRD